MSDLSDAIKAFVRTYSDMNPDEERAAALDLRERVADLEDENRELRRRNAELADENERLRKKLAARKRLERRDGAVYLLEDDGTETGPICPQCYESDGVIMLLERANGGAACSRCRTRYAGVAPAVDGYRARISY